MTDTGELDRLRNDLAITRLQIGRIDGKVKAIEGERNEFRRFVRSVLIANLLVGAVVLLTAVLT